MRETPPPRSWNLRGSRKLVFLLVAISLTVFSFMAPKNEQIGAGQRRVPFGVDGESAIGYRLLVETLRQRGYRVRTAMGAAATLRQVESGGSFILLEPAIEDLRQLGRLKYIFDDSPRAILIALPFLRGRQDPEGTATIDSQWPVDDDEVLSLLSELNDDWLLHCIERTGSFTGEVDPKALRRSPTGPYTLSGRKELLPEQALTFVVPEEALALQSVQVNEEQSLLSLDLGSSLLFEPTKLSHFESDLRLPKLAVLSDPGWLMNYGIQREPTQAILDRICDHLFPADGLITVCSFAQRSPSRPSFWDRFLEPPLRNLVYYLCFIFLIFLLAGLLRLPPLPKSAVTASANLNLSGVELRAKFQGTALLNSLNALMRVRSHLNRSLGRKPSEEEQLWQALQRFEHKVHSRSAKRSHLVAEAIDLSVAILGSEPGRAKDSKSPGQDRAQGVARKSPLAPKGEHGQRESSGPIEKFPL